MSAAETWRSNTGLPTAMPSVCRCWRPTLVRRQVTVLMANTTPPAFAAKAATATIPIVFVTGVDPVEVGLVASFNRPGANVTGVTFLSNKLVAKRLELLAALVSGAAPIGMLAHTRNPNTASDVRDALATAAALGRTLHVERVASASDLDTAVAALVRQRDRGAVRRPQADFRLWRQQILALAERHALPTSFSNSDFVVAGGLMSYGPHQIDSYREAGIYTGRILKGEKPAELPVHGVDQVRFRDQPQDREGARPDDPADHARARRRGDRMRRREFIIAARRRARRMAARGAGAATRADAAGRRADEPPAE